MIESLLPYVNQEMLHPEFWLSNMINQTTLSGSKNGHLDTSRYTFEQCNQILHSYSSHLADLRLLATEAARDPRTPLVLDRIVHASPDNRILFDGEGHPLDDAFWQSLAENAHTHVADAHIRPAVSVRPAAVRRWPTATAAFRTPKDREFDQFQDTVLHSGDPLLITHTSGDGVWLYGISETYAGWIRQDNLALTDWDTFNDWITTRLDGIVIAQTGIHTQPNPYNPRVSEKPVEFGAILHPNRKFTHEHWGTQTLVGNLPVLWPIRQTDGELTLDTAFLRCQLGVHPQLLKFSRKSVLTVAFRLLGERYGWGGSFGTHDCSSFIMDVYRMMGIQLPRDAGAQEKSWPDRVEFSPWAGPEQRCHVLSKFAAGDLLYMPGHALMYLGTHGGRPYVLHDFSGYQDSTTGQHVHVNEVMVSSLDLPVSADKTFLTALTSAISLFC